jgi:hypothetical protein
MTQGGIKYFSVILLLLLFLGKGLVTVLPNFIEHCFKAGQLEMPLTTETENTDENAKEKRLEIKEFLGNFFNDHTSFTKYALASKITRVRDCQFDTNVFLPVSTPPPKYID